MYKYYKKETDYGRTVCRRSVEFSDFENDFLKGFAILSLLVCLVSIVFMISKVPYTWIVAVSTLIMGATLEAISFIVANHKYHKTINNLRQDPKQEELKHIFNDETAKIRIRFESLYYGKKSSELTLEEIELVDKLRHALWE